ncbi:immunoglobulin-binding protein 1 [Cheilinus undulatus]|uniref:immunoglobulin-binding protein 1 n=1 Tax=Cheilinus undulatus TaxID=241271 RepID=UPI001BD514E8|nr:immunoglobulin-binding protein 1 [Cheilinus undulatus]
MAQCEIVGGADPGKLSDLLDGGWKIYEELEESSEPPTSSPVQQRVLRGLTLLTEAQRRVEQLQVFSRNEELEEVSTADLKYLLLPALLGALTLKLTSREQRLNTVRTARSHFMDYLSRCTDYHVTTFTMPRRRESTDEESERELPTSRPTPGSTDLVAMAAQRQAKIERFRQKKDLEARLSEVRRTVKSGQADDEVSREFYLLQVKRWISVSLDEIESIDQEEDILKNFDQMKHNTAPKQPPRAPMKPFILTKDAMQARVFGAGYPSLPTMTVDDWYEQHRKRGALPDQGIPRRVAVEEDCDSAEREEEEKERKAENEDEEALRKARDWDDWKDNHRRGYGNRQNMG